MTTPLVTIIIPVYNVKDYLVECLNSVINQTYKSLEVLVINDGSTDGSSDILKEYNEKYDHIRLISQENAGQSAARNKGIELANGKYLYFLDADDFILPETIGNLISELEKNQLDLIRFAAEPFADNIDYNIFSKQYDFQRFFTKGKVYNKKEFLEVNLKAYTMSPCLYIVRRDLLTENNIKFLPNILHEDELFTLQVFLQVNAASYDPNLYYKRRYRSNSVMTTNKNKNLHKSFDSYYIVLTHMGHLLEKHTGNLEKRLLKRRIRALYGIIANAYIDKAYKESQLEKLKFINKFDKNYYSTRYKLKMIAKKLYYMLKGIK